MKTRPSIEFLNASKRQLFIATELGISLAEECQQLKAELEAVKEH